MDSDLEVVLEKMAPDSKSILIVYISNIVNSVRFFSYGSNMNDDKFKNDMRNAEKELGKAGEGLGLINPVKRTLLNYKRVLSNKSIDHGLAFSISWSFDSQVEGICHDIPSQNYTLSLKRKVYF